MARSQKLRALAPHPKDLKRPVALDVPIEQARMRLQELEPAVFPIWLQLHQNDDESYVNDVQASCSHWDHKYARLFGAFLNLFAYGHLLDIGCGTSGLPSYLAGYPKQLITGIDPRPSRVPVDFEYLLGFNEFLPWPDESFHTVVSGTSLDHVLSLEKSIQEVRRVLTPDGIYLVWLASIPGAKAYAPRAADFAPADRFHLFHFDRKWVEPMFERYFCMEEVCVITQPGFDHVFYCLRKAPNSRIA
jgi:SAM-dependent methyltransferase